MKFLIVNRSMANSSMTVDNTNEKSLILCIKIGEFYLIPHEAINSSLWKNVIKLTPF